jgi:hypothetical protein
MRKLSVVSVLLTLLAIAGTPLAAQVNPPSNQSFVGGRFVAKNYAYPGVRIFSGNNASGAATITLSSASVRLQDGRTIVPFSAGGFNILGQPGSFPAIPITVGAGTTKETVTPTAASGCYVGAPQGSCSITATFANAHGQGELVTSGSAGIQEAINDAAFFGGGLVTVDGSANFYLGGSASVTAAIVAALPMPSVAIEDTRSYAVQYWTVQPSASTILAAPAVLTNTTVTNSTTPAGLYTNANAYVLCVTYVDVLGQEGQCSPTFSQTPTAATGNSFSVAAPVAATGAVGYRVYISLTNGTYTLSYLVPLVTQPTVVGAYPVANGVCTLTTIELTTPACAVANTSYGQLGSAATVTALTLSTSPIIPQITIASSTTVYVPDPGGRQSYAYAPGMHLGTPGLPASTLAFTITTGALTIVPNVVGTINVPPGFMNQVGRTIEVCGEATTTATAATIEDIQIQWDSVGQNTAGKGVLIGDFSATNTLATTGHLTFCEDFETTVASASATGGSINHVGGFLTSGGVTTAAASGGGDVVTPGTIGSLNLADDARINIIYLHTTSTDGAGWILQNAFVRVIN